MWLLTENGLYNMDCMRNITIDNTALRAEYLGSFFLTLRDYETESESHNSLSRIYDALKSGKTVYRLPQKGWLKEKENEKNNV